MNSYSHDLREKIVEAVSGRSMAKSAAARTFGVSLSSVKRYVKKANHGESLPPNKSRGSSPCAAFPKKDLCPTVHYGPTSMQSAVLFFLCFTG